MKIYKLNDIVFTMYTGTPAEGEIVKIETTTTHKGISTDYTLKVKFGNSDASFSYIVRHEREIFHILSNLLDSLRKKTVKLRNDGNN